MQNPPQKQEVLVRTSVSSLPIMERKISRREFIIGATSSVVKFGVRGPETSRSKFDINPKLDIDKMYLTDLERDRVLYWQDLIEKMAKYYGWDANLAASQMIAESGGNDIAFNDFGAVGLWGIVVGVRGAPGKEALLDPFINATWHFAKMVNLCREQMEDIRMALIRYSGGEPPNSESKRYAERVLIKAGYANQMGHPLVPLRCKPGKVPEPPIKDELNVKYG